jgi:hypothetical protein
MMNYSINRIDHPKQKQHSFHGDRAMKTILICAVIVFLFIPISKNAELAESKLNENQFQKLMQTMADGWNEGDAKKAVDCFTADAVYTEPPDKQIYKGRDQLFNFFGGNKGRSEAMSMTWHHLIFDEKTQIGAGEFTFTYGSTVHGVAMIKIRDGKIGNWREYWYESPLAWEKFTAANPF